MGLYGTIVVGYDEGNEALDALALASVLRAPDGRVIAACVHPIARFPHGRRWEAAMRDAARETSSGALERAGEGAGWLDARAVPGDSAAHGLHELAEASAADLLVVGSSRRAGGGRTRPGGVGERLLNGSPCPVAVAPRGFRDEAAEPRVVGIAFDGSAEATVAMREGVALAHSFGAAVRLLSVAEPVAAGAAPWTAGVSPRALERDRREELRRALEETAAALSRELRAQPLLLDGPVAAALVAEADKGVHLLVMGSRAYGPMMQVLLGGTAAEVMRSAPCPVLVVPRAAATPNVHAETQEVARA
jgi:nucleotide-binding universal stress UspA family protein